MCQDHETPPWGAMSTLFLSVLLMPGFFPHLYSSPYLSSFLPPGCVLMHLCGWGALELVPCRGWASPQPLRAQTVSRIIGLLETTAPSSRKLS